jgi:hypothetical protein
LYLTTIHSKKYLIGFCVLLLIGALAVYTMFIHNAPGIHAAATATRVNAFGTAQGCPSNSVMRNVPRPNVTITPRQAKTTITVRTGDLIQFQFPFGSRWGGPTTSQGNLTLQPPAGYANRTAHMCVWRFTAASSGTTQLNFTQGPLCKPGYPCPYFVILVRFTILVQ